MSSPDDRLLVAGDAIFDLNVGCLGLGVAHVLAHKAVAALRQVWAGLGFERFRDGVHVLDLSLVTLDEKLGQLRKNAERYRTRRD